jgi:hypothetical protein
LLSLGAAGNSIKDGQLRLLNRRDSIVDGNSCLPLQSLGVALSMSHIYVMLCLGNVCLQGVNIGGDFCSYRGPVSNGCVANGLDFLFYLFGCLRGSSTCLPCACLDFIMRLLLDGGRRVLGILGANG